MTQIVLTAMVGSSVFDIHVENADATQLLGASALLGLMGQEAFAEMRAGSIASQIEQRGIVVPGNRQQRRSRLS